MWIENNLRNYGLRNCSGYIHIIKGHYFCTHAHNYKQFQTGVHEVLGIYDCNASPGDVYNDDHYEHILDCPVKLPCTYKGV